MRRAILAMTLGGALLTATACDSAADPSAAPASSDVVEPSAAPVSSPPDYTINTKLVCANVQKTFDSGLKDFATDLGKMIANKEAKQTAAAKTAQKAAATELAGVGTELKKETQTAEDPQLRTAGATSAAKFAKSAKDDKFFNKIKTTKDLSLLEAQFNEWFTPVAGYCAAPITN